MKLFAKHNDEQQPDIKWYCIACLALLSAQSEFSDDCGIWECFNCGYLTKVDVSEIV